MRLSSIVGTAVLAAACTIAARPAQAQTDIVLTSLNLTGITPTNGGLTASGGTVSGLLNGLPFTTDIENFNLRTLPGNGRRCSVLHLELAPIHIALLGLHVDTSPICLDITAFKGRGLLGDLLCGLAGGNLPLLGSPDLLSGLSDILTEALGRAKGVNGNGNGGGGGDSVCTGDCEVLDLVLGPLTLNLLGVQVKLDDCDNGPVEVCVSATATEGLLGSLLCGLTDDLNLVDLLAALVDGGLLDDVNLNDLVNLIEDLLDVVPVG